MSEILVLSIVSLGVFLASLAISYGLAWLIKRSRSGPIPPAGATIRIRSGSRLYRSKFLGPTADGWAFQPPLENGVPVPLRVGDALLVEAPCDSGALRFRSQLVWRSTDPLMMVMQPPGDARLVDRRSSKRIAPLGDINVLLEGARAALVDIGEHGARLWTDLGLKRGERVHLSTFWSKEPLAAHVLDVSDSPDAEFMREVRVVFEQPTSLESLQKQFAPAG